MGQKKTEHTYNNNYWIHQKNLNRMTYLLFSKVSDKSNRNKIILEGFFNCIDLSESHIPSITWFYYRNNYHTLHSLDDTNQDCFWRELGITVGRVSMAPSKYMVRESLQLESVGNNRCSHSHRCNIGKGFGCGLTGNQGKLFSSSFSVGTMVVWKRGVSLLVSGYINGGVGKSFL